MARPVGGSLMMSDKDFRWCRWWESNPHVMNHNGFWVRQVYQFHHTGKYRHNSIARGGEHSLQHVTGSVITRGISIPSPTQIFLNLMPQYKAALLMMGCDTVRRPQVEVRWTWLNLCRPTVSHSNGTYAYSGGPARPHIMPRMLTAWRAMYCRSCIQKPYR